jgi:hypothetical protein
MVSELPISPINPIDYKVCRKERRMQTQKNVKLRRCFEYRKLALKCFYMEEDEFVDTLIERHEEKKRFVAFLEQEGSILASAFKDKSSVFKVRNVSGNEMD